MDARFNITAPDSVSVTMRLTANLNEWKKLRQALESADEFSGEANEFARKIGKMIEETEKTLAADKWTTGYATGDTEKKA